MIAFINYHNEMKNSLKLMKEKNSNVTIKNIQYAKKIQSVKKSNNLI
jgi:hypothetical protein